MKTDWTKLKNMPDEEIDYSDIPKLDTFDWTKANVVIPEAKTRLTIRVDSDVYQFFKARGPKYQTRINAVLRSYMEAQMAS